jgi:hypothetical protein
MRTAEGLMYGVKRPSKNTAPTGGNSPSSVRHPHLNSRKDRHKARSDAGEIFFMPMVVEWWKTEVQ